MAPNTIKVSLAAPIPEFLVYDVRAKLAYLDTRVQDADLNGSRDTISLALKESMGQSNAEDLETTVRELVRKMTEDAFEPDMKILDRHDGSMPYSDDPMIALRKSREVREEGLGFYAIGPLLTEFISFVDQRIQEIAAQMDASRYRFPALISPEYMERVQYFKNFPHSLSFVTHLEENIKGIEQFSNEASCCDGRLVADPALFAGSPALLSPTVCHHLYCALENCQIAGQGMTATAAGHCFRYESRNMQSLERVWNFTMREIIFVGEEAYVSDQLTRVRNAFRSVLEELDLSYAVMTANDPFFVGTYRDQAAYQAAFELKYEIRAQLPYRNETLAVGSFNRHSDFFGKQLNIRNEDGSAASTGCFGVGFERIALAFVAQHGPDPSGWPRIVRETAIRVASSNRRFVITE